MRRFIEFAILVAVLVLGYSPSQGADSVRVDFSGSIAWVYDPFGYIGPTITEGDTVWGFYTYETGVMDSEPLPTIGKYIFTSASQFVVNLEDIVFYSDTNNVHGLLRVEDHPPGSDLLSDKYSFRNSNVLSIPPTLNGTERLLFELEDSTATALRNDALPTTAPNREHWADASWIAIIGAGFTLTAVLDSICCWDPTGIKSPSPPRLRPLRNYPNPFASGTEITVILDEATSGSLTIFSVGGKMVARLFEGQLGSGIQSFWWNGRDSFGELLPSGVYFCVLEAGGMKVAKKLTIVR